MRKFKCVLLFCFVLVLIAGCSKEEIQPEPLNTPDDIALKKASAQKMNGERDHYVPFKGTFEVQIAKVIKQSPPPPKIQEVTGSGNATHLGKTEVYIYQEWRPYAVPAQPPPVPTGNGEGYFKFTF